MISGKEFKRLRNNKGLTLKDVAKHLGVAEQTINKYESETVRRIPSDKIEAMAYLYGVSPAYIMEWEEPSNIFEYKNIKQITKKQIPMLGEIACGKPTMCNETHEVYVSADADLDADFCLTAHGDSMIGARINDGDLVFIHQQPTVENGEIAAVVIGDDATLKRVYYYSDSDIVSLVAENPKYPPLVYKNNELDQIVILGKAIAFQSNI